MPARAGSLKPQQVRVVARARWQQRAQMNGRTRQNPAYRPSANYPLAEGQSKGKNAKISVGITSGLGLDVVGTLDC